MDKITFFNRRVLPFELMLALGSAICILLMIFRMYVSSSIYYVFFVWNLVLAWIPFIIADSVVKMDVKGRSNFFIGALLLIWLLFFPNCPYIITDLFHLKKVQNIPLWFDLVLIMSFAWNGLMLGYVSLLKIQKYLNVKFGNRWSWGIILSVLCISSFGIYLGRFERWNSWDVLTNPFALFGNIIEHFMNPLAHPKTVGVTLFFSLFLVSSYSTLFYLVDSKNHEE